MDVDLNICIFIEFVCDYLYLSFKFCFYIKVNVLYKDILVVSNFIYGLFLKIF